MVNASDDDATSHHSYSEHDIARIGDRSDTSDHDRALTEIRADLSIDELRRQRRARERLREDVTIGAMLRGSLNVRTTLWMSDGTSASGVIVEVGNDYVCMDTGADRLWIRTAEITAVRSAGDPATAPVESPESGSSLSDVMEDLIMSEVMVTITIKGGSRLSGAPVGAHRTVMIRDDHGFCVIALDSIITVSLIPGNTTG